MSLQLSARAAAVGYLEVALVFLAAAALYRLFAPRCVHSRAVVIGVTIALGTVGMVDAAKWGSCFSPLDGWLAGMASAVVFWLFGYAVDVAAARFARRRKP